MSTVISIKVTEDQLKRAEDLYSFGALKNSITKGKSNIYGAIGEIVAVDYLNQSGRDAKIQNTPNYDLLVNGRTVDIKTKKTTVPPLQNFNCSISAHNTTQKCDHYMFVRVSEDKTTAWILGYIPKDDFFKRAKFFRKGQKDPIMPAWKFTADCYNLEISKLTTLERKT